MHLIDLLFFYYMLNHTACKLIHDKEQHITAKG